MKKDDVKLNTIPKTGKPVPGILIPKQKKRVMIRFFLYGSLFFLILAVSILFIILRALPSIDSLKNFNPPLITEVFDINAEKIGEFYKERRMLTPLERIPKLLKDAFVASEDDRFYEHKGIDYQGIMRAMLKNIMAGEVKQGGSTITQQVAKSLLLTPEKSITRKIREAVLAYRMEKNLSKEEILYLYLNQIYLGHGAYGVAAAAENYYAKKLDELDLCEASILAGLVQAPSKYNPFTHMDRAKVRQTYVLDKMLSNGYITEEERDKALAEEPKLVPRQDFNKKYAPYFVENLRKYLVEKYGNDVVLTAGYKVYTTIDARMQTAANKALKKGLEDLDKRQGYRGPLEIINPPDFVKYIESLKETNDGKAPEDNLKAVVTDVDDEKGFVTVNTGLLEGAILLEDMKWARRPDPEVHFSWIELSKPSAALKPGFVIEVKIKEDKALKEKLKSLQPKLKNIFSLEQEPTVEGALVSMDVGNGYIKAMVGGYDFERSEFNRTTQALRQPGSAFKPVIYAAAVDKGYSASSMLVDAPVIFDDPSLELQWRPKNYGGKFSGKTIFREALITSRNVPTVKIVEDIGIEYVMDYAKKIGVISPLTRDFSLALGSSVMTPLELIKVYAVFPTGGKIVEPVFITRIEDPAGQILEENVQEPSLRLLSKMTPTPTPVLTPGETPTETPKAEETPSPITESAMAEQNAKEATNKHYLPDGVISEETAYIITHLLKEVVHYGTGYNVRAINRPVAGKTGTTNDSVDAWFVGYTPDIVSGVWVGFDEKKPLGKGEVGAVAASPIWLEFMQGALAGTPVKDFTVPPGIVFAKIDPKTGKLAAESTKNPIFEAFLAGTEPTEKSGQEKDSQIKNFFTGGE